MSQGPSERVWVVEADEHGYIDPQELAEVACDVATVVKMIGGISYVGADRAQDDRGMWFTRAMVFRWNRFIPEQKAADVEPDEQPESVKAE
jgi:hypothetical protein